MSVEMLEALTRYSHKVGNESKSRSFLSRAEIMPFDGYPLNYCLFIKTFENNGETCTEDDSMRLQLLIQYCTGKMQYCCGTMSRKDGYLKVKKTPGGMFRRKASGVKCLDQEII